MKTLHDMGVAGFENNIENFNYCQHVDHDKIRNLCLYSIGLKNQLEIFNIPWTASTQPTKLADALAYVVSPLIGNKIESGIFSLIFNTEKLSKIIDSDVRLEIEFRPLVQLTKTIQEHFDEDWSNEYLVKERIKNSNVPIKEQHIRTVKDLLDFLNQVITKEMLIDDFRLDNGPLVHYTNDFSSGELRVVKNYKIHPSYDGFIDCVISSTLTVQKFITMLTPLPVDTWVKSIRLKGSDNMVYMTVEPHGLVVCD